MIDVLIGGHGLREKRYVLKVLLVEWLGLEIRIQENSHSHTELRIGEKKTLILEDHFFAMYGDEYLKLTSIPLSVTSFENRFFSRQLPLIYGRDFFEVSDDKIICGFDLIAATYFMLARWEEVVVLDRDSHSRFLSTTSLAVREDFIGVPVANAYCEGLWEMIRFLGTEQNRLEHKYHVVPTHDVDVTRFFRGGTSDIKKVLSSLVKRNKDSASIWRAYAKKLRSGIDPWDTFDFLMDASEFRGVKSYFFWMSGGTSPRDNAFNINSVLSKKIISRIKKRGHKIGLHPSYNSYNDIDQLRKEKSILENIVEQEVKFGRHHYLRFEIPTTWDIWEELGFDWDSTMYYARSPGFRCGACLPFTTFNCKNRTENKLKERPLILMDGSYSTYGNSDPRILQEQSLKLKDEVARYGGEFIVLWHNSSFGTGAWNKLAPLYRSHLLGNQVL